MAKKKTHDTSAPDGADAPGPLPEILTHLSDQQRRAVTVLAEAGYRINSGRLSGAVSLAAAAAQVSRVTIYNWLKLSEFTDALEACNALFIVECLENLRRAARAGDTRATLERLIIFDSEAFDRQLARDRLRFQHEKEMLQLKIAAGIDVNDNAPPDFNYTELPKAENPFAKPESH
jgi:hypothetical protein